MNPLAGDRPANNQRELVPRGQSGSVLLHKWRERNRERMASHSANENPPGYGPHNPLGLEGDRET